MQCLANGFRELGQPVATASLLVVHLVWGRSVIRQRSEGMLRPYCGFSPSTGAAAGLASGFPERFTFAPASMSCVSPGP